LMMWTRPHQNAIFRATARRKDAGSIRSLIKHVTTSSCDAVALAAAMLKIRAANTVLLLGVAR
jgi:hypothetical protein